MLYFENDYSEGAHPAILQRLMDTNMEPMTGYGFDFYSQKKDQGSLPMPGSGNLFSGRRNPDESDSH